MKRIQWGRWLLFLPFAAVSLLTGQSPPAFDAASIHALEPPFQRLKTLTISGTRVTLDGYGITWLVAEAYGLKDYQVVTNRIPQSQLSVYYRIEARAPGAAVLSRADMRAMLQTLLAERFHLTVHHETRPMAVYALVISKNGPLLKPGSETANGDCASRIGPVIPTDRNYKYSFTNCTLEPLVNTLPGDRPVVDKTGLTGRYDITFFATPEFRMRDTTEPGDIRFLDAIRPLGLQLDAQNVPMEVLVVDHSDASPSGN